MARELGHAEKAILVGIGTFEVLLRVAAHAGDLAVLGGVELAVLVGVEAGVAGLDAFGENGEPGLFAQRGGKLGGVDEAVGVGVAGFEVLFAVMPGLHVERQVFGEGELLVFVFVRCLDDAGDERSVVCGQERDAGKDEEGEDHGSRNERIDHGTH